MSAKVVHVLQSASCYEALYTPSLRTRGNCQLLVKVNGCLIGNEPMPVFVECPPEILDEPVYIINNIQQPGCLKITNNGHMFCRSTSGICIFDINNTSRPPVLNLAEFFQKMEESRSGGHVKWQSIMSLSSYLLVIR